MRRGHSGAGGWRSENVRPFRPRGSGNPNFRPPRPFGLLDLPRFPPPGPRQFRGPFSQRPGRQEPEHHDRNKYRLNNLHRPQGRGYHNRGQIPVWQHDHGDSFNELNSYKKPNRSHVNDTGEFDHRHQHQISPWASNLPGFENNRQYYDDHRSPHKTSRQYNIGDDIQDYPGHRPPASDHYSNSSGPNSNNSQYSHSVDDTVDIVRKRLKDRDKQQNFDTTMNHQSNVDENLRQNTCENYQNVPQQPPVRKKTPRQKQNIKSNCDKIKNKIVHQLFKMDKSKMHKLMDDPSSSTKFEYAISSLITEGQNSLNRHLRSAAEKSLCSSSTDFIQDDTNTIYEDTFMKQMQGVLDPQDTMLLEDIKPLVMAELCRVLQVDNYHFELMQDQGFQYQGIHDHGFQNQGIEDHGFQNQGMQEHEMYDQEMQNFVNEHETYNKEEPSNCQYIEEEQIREQQFTFYDKFSTGSGNNTEVITGDDVRFHEEINFEPKPLFQRRPAKKADDNERRSLESMSRGSIDKNLEYQQEKSNKSIVSNSPKEHTQAATGFDPNTEQLSDEDDPFAEFDKQYHVAVDPNFMEYASRPASPVFSSATNSQSSSEKLLNASSVIQSATKSVEIEKELDAKLHNISQASAKIFPNTVTSIKSEHKNIDVEVNKKDSEHILEKENLSAATCDHVETTTNHIPHEESSKKKEIKKEPEKHDSSALAKSILQSNTRKRSTDQKPSHRKEKHKRSSQSECQEAAKSIMNMFYTGDNKDSSKTTKKPDSTAKTYSDKYVKRKEPQKKAQEKPGEDSKTIEVRNQNSNTPNHSITSPKDNLLSEMPSKSDLKIKLKPIDIFGSQAPKKATAHQARRNTAPVPQVANSPDDKPKLTIPTATSFARKLTKRHIGTQVLIKVKDRDCQTVRSKTVSKQTQTVSISINEAKIISSNPLERMKEIDMEIQLLLQEKFKLYNSLETKAATVPLNTIPSLSMRVFEVNTEQHTEQPHNEQDDPEADTIVNDFASIPTEELEQIALESLAEEKLPSTTKKTRRQRVVHLKQSSASPATKRNNKKLKSPNISLIEQIITDDRPIEDIISLDDLENAPILKTPHVKGKKKPQKVSKKKSTKKSNSRVVIDSKSKYDIKECSVVLIRIDTSKYLQPKVETFSSDSSNSQLTFEVPIVDISSDILNCIEEHTHTPEVIREELQPSEPNVVQVVEDVVNDLQFDMLDVSEDIIIGDNCEAKTIDKVKEIVSEEIILDNSQSSMEDGAPEMANIEDECKMYDYSNENLRRDTITVTGNADAVLAIECIDNQFIAACLDGNVYHFNEEGQLLNTLRGTNQAVTCLTIVKEKYGTTVYTGSLDSRMRYYDLETGLEKGPECNVLSPIQTMDKAWDTIFVGTRTGFVLQFECKNNMVIPVSTVKFSEQSILALRAMKEGPRKVLLVAARSENVVTVKDAQTGLLLRTLQGPKMTVYTLLYEDGKVYCGTSSHNIHVFDYTTGSHVGSHEGGKGAVCLRASGGLVFAGCYDGCVYVYREGEARPRAQLRGPALMLLSLAIHGTKIIAGYKDRGLYIWKMPLAIVQEMIL